MSSLYSTWCQQKYFKCLLKAVYQMENLKFKFKIGIFIELMVALFLLIAAKRIVKVVLIEHMGAEQMNTICSLWWFNFTHGSETYPLVDLILHVCWLNVYC